MATRNLDIKKEEMNMEQFIEYCRLFIVNNIYKQLPATSMLDYNLLTTTVNSISSTMFKGIDTETGRLLLANKLFSVIKCVTDEDYPIEYLYDMVASLADCKPKDPLDEVNESFNLVKEAFNDYIKFSNSTNEG